MTDAYFRALIAEMREQEAEHAAQPATEVARFGADMTSFERAELERLTGETSTTDPEVARLLALE